MEITNEMLIPPTEEEAKKLRQRIEDAISLGYEGFEKAKPSLPGRGLKIMRFSMLPHSELHDRFKEILVKPDIEKKQGEESSKLKGRMKNGINSFIADNHIDKYREDEVKYKIVRRTIIDNGKDEVLQIGIPYEKNLVIGFGNSLLVYKSKTPEIFDSCVKNYKVFDGSPDFSF